MTFTKITVQEQYETSTGDPASGSVEFAPVDQMHNGSVTVTAPTADTLDTNGNLSIILNATTDPATRPTGVTYRVIERILGQPVRTYYVAVPHNQGSPLQLADLPTAATGGAAGFALRNAVDYDDGTPPTDGQAMVWDSTTSKFHPETVAGVGAGVSSVNGQTGAVTVSPAGIGAQPVDSDLTTIAALSPTDGSLLERVAGTWQARTPAQVKGDLALDLVNNTSDTAKPVSTATQTALNAKAPTASPTFTGTVAAPRLVGNLVTVAYAATVTLDASAGSTFRCVATGNLAVTAINGAVQGQEVKLEVQASGGARTVTVNGVASTVASGEWGTWRLTWNTATSLWVPNALPAPSAGGSVTSVNGQAGAVTITAAGLGAQPVDSDLTDIAALTPANGDFLERAGGVWAARTGAQAKADLGLDQVSNTSDAAKPVSTATQAALNLKAPLADPTFTGTPTAPRFVGATATVAYAAALTLNAAAASTFRVTATGDITSVAITGGTDGQSVRLQVFASGADRTVTAFGVATAVPSGTWGAVGWSFNASSSTWIQDRTTITGGGAVSSVNGQTGAVTITAAGLGAQPVDSDLTTFAALGPTDGSLLSRQGGVWTGRTTAQVKTDMALGNVDNTSDANKPISNAAATSLAAKAPLVSPALTNPTANRFLGAVQTVAYAASVTLDSSAATTFRCVATGPLTVADITNGANGQEIALEVQASGGDRVLTIGAVGITISAGLWWTGTLRYDQPLDTWKLAESNGGTATGGGGGGVPDDGSVTNAKVAVSADISLDKTADSATRLALTAAERTKLAGVATAATANSSDAQLRDRATHTGTQAISTVTGLQAELDSKAESVDVFNTAAPAPLLNEAWTGADAAAWPARWTTIPNGGVADILGNAGRHVTSTTANTRVESTLTGAVGDGEILYRWQWVTPGITNRITDLRFRAADTSNANCYVIGTTTSSTSLIARTASVSTTLGIGNWVPTLGAWYWFRVRFVGSDLKVRWWADGTAEPTEWTLTATDSAHSTGLITLSNRNNSAGTGAYTFLHDDFQLWQYPVGGAATDEAVQDVVGPMFTGGTHTGISYVYDDLTGRINSTVSGGGGGGYATAQDEGAAVTQRPVLNFIGTGVTVSDDAGGARTTVNIPGVTGGGTGSTGASGVLVASTDMPTAVKDAADFVCDGTADQVQINAAIDIAAALNSRNANQPVGAQQRGRVFLTGGRFNLSGSVLMRTGVHLEGSGWLTEVRMVSAGAAHAVALASPSEHICHVSNMWLNGNFSAGGTGNGIDFDMTASGSTSTYPDMNPDSDHLIHDMLITGFSSGSRTGIHLWSTGTGNNRGNIVDRVQIRSCSNNGVHFEAASDSYISNTHVGTIGNVGHLIGGGNTKLSNTKSFFCDVAGFSFTSGRIVSTGLESQDNATGVIVSGADFTGTGWVIDTSSADGLLLTSSEAVLNGVHVFLRGSARYATQTNGIRLSGTLNDLNITGRIDPANITNKFVGTPGARSFVRVSDGTTLISAG